MNILKNRRALTEFKKEDGCELSEPKEIFFGIYAETSGHPCDGCLLGECNLLKRFQQEDRNSNSLGNLIKQLKPKTNAELAAELGISKRQAAKINRQQNQ
jgi:hypothetical protein